MERRYAGNRLRSFDTRPLCDVPAAAFITKPAPRITQRTRTCTFCLWGGGAERELITQARRGALVVLGSPFVEQCRADERHLSFDVRPWCNVPVAGFNTKTAPRVTQRRRTRALCFWGGGAAREPVTRARRGACCARTLLRGRAACRREAFPLRRVALVRHASCGLQRQASAVRHVQRTSSKEEAQHLIPLFARAVPPWFWSSPHLRKALRRLEASLLRHAPVVRCASCGPQHQASTACHSTQAHLISPSLERRRSTRACFSHASWRAGCVGKSLRRRAACRQ